MNLNSLFSAALEFQVESRLKLTIAQVATTTTTSTYAVQLQQQQQLEWSHCRLTVSAPSSIRQQGPQQRDQQRSVDLDQISLAVSLSLPLTAPSPSAPPLSLSLHIAIAVFFLKADLRNGHALFTQYHNCRCRFCHCRWSPLETGYSLCTLIMLYLFICRNFETWLGYLEKFRVSFHAVDLRAQRNWFQTSLLFMVPYVYVRSAHVLGQVVAG